MHFVTPHNNVGFNCRCSEDTATEITKKSPVLTTPLLFDVPRHGTPRNVRMNLIPLESRVPGLHFLAVDSMGLSTSNFRD